MVLFVTFSAKVQSCFSVIHKGESTGRDLKAVLQCDLSVTLTCLKTV